MRQTTPGAYLLSAGNMPAVWTDSKPSVTTDNHRLVQPIAELHEQWRIPSEHAETNATRPKAGLEAVGLNE